jgi:DNA primase
MIPQKLVDEIRDRTDIVQVIGSLLDLRKSGRNFKTLCPFHSEKTPSFMVSPDKQIYHCFGCGKGGNVFHFLMEYEGVGFVEAVSRLGRDLGIDVDRYSSPGSERGKLDPYYRAMEFTAGFYQRMLFNGAGSEAARRYLERRGFSLDLVREFGLGYAPSAWDGLYRAALEEGISKEVLLELSVVLRSRGGSGYRDYFRNRIIFPIRSLSNRVVGLAGRVLDNTEPKYLNTAESPIYSKGRILYGLNQSKDYIRKQSSAIIVEGYIDYLMLWMKKVRNISAVCGTSLTEDQTRLLARYTKRVYIINDGDRAGIRAAVRAADQLVIEGLECRIVVLPEGEDPDSYVRQKGADGLIELMQSAPHYFDFLRSQAGKGARKAFKRDQIIKHLLDTVSRIGDGVRKELYLQEISELFSIPVDSLRTGLKAARPARRASEPSLAPVSKREKIQKFLFRIGLEDEKYARMICEGLIEEDLEGVLYREYYKALDLALKNHIDIKSPDFIGAIESVELSTLASEIALMEKPPGPEREYIADTLVWLKKAALRDELSLMKKRLVELEGESGVDVEAEEIEIAEAYRRVTKELKKLGRKEDS